MLHDRYPSFKGLLDGRRHLVFGYGDARELAMLGVQLIAILLAIVFTGALILVPVLFLAVYIRFREIHTHAQDPWYYVLRRHTTPETLHPERSAMAADVVNEHFPVDTAIANATLTRWQKLRKWFNKDESFGEKPAARNQIGSALPRLDQPLFGSILARVTIPGVRYPTGRELLYRATRSKLLTKLGVNEGLRMLRHAPIIRYALPDWLPWRSKADRFTVRQKDESYIRSWRLIGSSPEPDMLGKLKARFDAALIRLPQGCTFHTIIRMTRDTTDIPQKIYPLEAAALAAHEHANRQGETTRISVTVDAHLVYQPHRDPENPLRGDTAKAISIGNYRRFVGIATLFQTMLDRAWDQVIPLAREEVYDEQYAAIAAPLTFGSATPVHVRKTSPNALIANLLGRHTLTKDRAADGSPTGYLRLDDQLVAVYDLYDIEAQTVDPDALRIIEGYEPPILLSMRWTVMSAKEERKELSGLFRESVKNSEHADKSAENLVMPNLAAHDQAQDSMQLDRLVQSHQARLGYTTITMAIYQPIVDGNLKEARAALSARTGSVQGAIHHLGYNFSNTPDNLIPSFLGIIPGNTRDNQLINPVPSGFIANLVTTYAPWLGSPVIRTDEKLFVGNDGEPVASLWNTTGMDRRRFGWSPQFGRGSGHSLFIADTGSGKSTYIAACISEFLANDVALPSGARVILIDRDGSNKIHAALHHADMLVCGDHATRGFRLYGNVETEHGRELIIRATEAMIVARRGTLDTAKRNDIDKMMAHLADTPFAERSADAAILESDISLELKELLKRYTEEQAGLLFSDRGKPFTNRYTYVDIAPALASSELRLPVLFALMSSIEEAAETQPGPIFLIAEEFWEFLLDEVLSEVFIKWLKRLRKFGVWIWLVTHQLEDLDGLDDNRAEKIMSAIKNIVFFPSARFYDAKVVKRMSIFGVTPEKIRDLADYAPVEGKPGESVALICQGKQGRLIPTGLGSVGRAICGSTDKTSRERFAQLLVRHNGRITKVLPDWIRERGGKHRHLWAAEAERLTREYEIVREENGLTAPNYDPRLFNEDILELAEIRTA